MLSNQIYVVVIIVFWLVFYYNHNLKLKRSSCTSWSKATVTEPAQTHPHRFGWCTFLDSKYNAQNSANINKLLWIPVLLPFTVVLASDSPSRVNYFIVKKIILLICLKLYTSATATNVAFSLDICYYQLLLVLPTTVIVIRLIYS